MGLDTGHGRCGVHWPMGRYGYCVVEAWRGRTMRIKRGNRIININIPRISLIEVLIIAAIMGIIAAIVFGE